MTPTITVGVFIVEPGSSMASREMIHLFSTGPYSLGRMPFGVVAWRLRLFEREFELACLPVHITEPACTLVPRDNCVTQWTQ